MKQLRTIFLLLSVLVGYCDILRAQAPGLYINEVSQGPSGSKEYVELIVVGNPTCFTIPTLDLRGWYIDDNNGFHATGAGTGIAQGCVRFTQDPLWAAVPVGTLIVIHNDADINASVPPTDLSLSDGNCRLVIPVSNCALLEKHLTLPSVALSPYPATGFAACGNWANISMANSDDSFQTIDPAGNLFHSVSWGNNTLSTIIYFAGTSAGLVAQMTNAVTNNITTQANWTRVAVGGNESPGAPNNVANQTWICRMNNGCTPVTPMLLSMSSTNASCTCTGSATVTASGGFNGCGGGYTYTWAPSGGTAATATGLCAGTYTVTVADVNGCTATQTVNITASTSFTLTTTQTNVACFGGNTGSASVAVSGGTGPFSYAWTPSGGTAATAIGLVAGTYTATVTDASGCTGTSIVTITQPPALATTGTQTNVLCNGGLTGSASVVASGGTGSYTYVWTPSGGTAATATGLGAGTYTATVTDANGCTTTRTFSITQPPALATTGTQTNVLCNGGLTGSASVVASGGTGLYTYAWTPSGGTAATATGLGAGTYTVTVTDANGCTTTRTFTITQPTPLASTTSFTQATCAASNGSAAVVVTGGTGPYTYLWSPSGGTGATASALAAGVYTVVYTDANGCTGTATVNITNSSAPTATITATTNVSCFAGNNGSATVTASGGTGPYTYAWTPTGGTGTTGTPLIAGNYTVTVTDANGCTTTATTVITQPPAVTASATSTPVLCFGGTTGTASATAGGGVGLYTYSWAPSGGTGSSATALAAGVYTVTITDANGCTATATTTVTQPTVLATTGTQTNVLCNGGLNGSASVVASGGTGPYTCAWTPSGGTGSTATGLGAGAYTVTVTDANGCTTTRTFTITQPTPLASTTSFTQATCAASNGAAAVTVSGGTGPYTYLWSPSGGTGATASALAAGVYTVVYTDANGCTGTATVNVTNANAPAISIVASDSVNCFGGNDGFAAASSTGGTSPYNYLWSNADTDTLAGNLTAGSYTVTVTDANGCIATTTISIGEPPLLTSSTTVTNVLCFGGNTGSATAPATGGVGPYSWLWTPSGGTNTTASGLIAGTYTATITDANGCSTTAIANVTEPSIIAASTTVTNILCFSNSNGSASVSVTGGVGPYAYSWSPSGGTSPNASGLIAGNYSVTITDANGCTAIAVAALTEPTALSATTSFTQATCNSANGSAEVVVTGGTAAYSYLWSPSGGSNALASGLTAGSYSCLVTDANGCTMSLPITVPNANAPTASIGTTSNVTCFGGNDGSATASAIGGVGPYVYLWSNSDPDSLATSLVAGTYTITVTDASGCTSTSTVLITEPTQVNVQASANPASVCEGFPTTLTATAGGGTPGYTYVWTPGPLAGQTQNIIPVATQTYVVTVADANGCTTSTPVIVTVNPAPVGLLAADDTAGCAPLCVNFSDLSAISTGTITGWSWDFGDNTNSTQQDPNHCYTSPGIYSVVLTVTSASGCTGTITVGNYINVFATPIAGFTYSPQPVTMLNPNVTFTDTSQGATTWFWSFGDLLQSTSTQQNPTFNYDDAECHQVVLTVTNPGGCTDTAIQEICVDPEVTLYVPNTFTPDDNGTNEFFMPVGTGLIWSTLHMMIFDRWGNLIYETFDINDPWDGRVQGSSDLVQIDTYVWKIDVTDIKNNKHSLIGHVNVIR